ncbi:hypothetical protein FXO38_27363 [Capsicum annuum]|nr:hypothetical protein FXO37_30860 [Capsicum annuum]KAF3630087.1 hypothetical protein FXO38_27363 [Capsicum annuum]
MEEGGGGGEWLDGGSGVGWGVSDGGEVNEEEMSSRESLLPSLITKLCKMVDIPTKVHDTMKNCDMAYNPLRGRSTKGERKKKGKIREEGQSSRSGKGGELDTLSTQSPLSLNGWKGDISMVPIYFGEDSISSTQVGSFKLDLPSCPGPSLC